MFTFTCYGPLVNAAFLLVTSCINSNWKEIIQSLVLKGDKGAGKHCLPTRLKQTLAAIWCTMFLSN